MLEDRDVSVEELGESLAELDVPLDEVSVPLDELGLAWVKCCRWVCVPCLSLPACTQGEQRLFTSQLTVSKGMQGYQECQAKCAPALETHAWKTALQSTRVVSLA